MNALKPLPGHRAYLGLFILIAVVTLYRALVLATADIGLYVDEAYYWGWAQQLDWGYYSKPPMIAALIAFTTSLCGDGVFCVKSGALLVYPVTTWLVFRLGQVLFDARTGLWAAAVFLLMPGVALSNLIISTDVLLLLFWAWAMLALVLALQTNAWRHWLMLGVACGLGLLSKYTMVVFAPSALLALLLVPAWRTQLLNPRLWLAVLLALALFAPNIWWNAHHGWPTFQHTADISNLETSALHWDELGEFLGGQFAVFGLLALPLWLVAAFTLKPAPSKTLLLSFSLLFLGVISAQALFGRANANWAAPAFIAASVLLAYWGATRPRWLLAALALNLLLMFGAYHYERILPLFGMELNAKTDPFKRVRGWDALGEQFNARRAQAPGALLLSEEREALAGLGYYARLPLNEVLSWNPRGLLRHQYDLFHSLGAEHIGRDVLFVTSSAEPGEVAQHFASVQRLEPLLVPIHPGWALEYSVFLLKDFRG
ncbi:MAG: glycosyltransferase family 39 protein [Halothiobacillaceae bacterium]|nr:glycosyltransferase family 39 protein [Halothiobacillaceae bacterium]